MNDDMNNDKPLKPLPALLSDEAAERFMETENLADYDLSGFKPRHFEFGKKDARLELRIPREQLAALKEAASRAGIPHTRLVRQFIEQGLQGVRS